MTIYVRVSSVTSTLWKPLFLWVIPDVRGRMRFLTLWDSSITHKCLVKYSLQFNVFSKTVIKENFYFSKILTILTLWTPGNLECLTHLWIWAAFAQSVLTAMSKMTISRTFSIFLPRKHFYKLFGRENLYQTG